MEKMVKHLKPEIVKKNFYTIIDQFPEEELISNPKELMNTWAARKSIHIHLNGDVGEVRFTEGNYILWNSALGKMI